METQLKNFYRPGALCIPTCSPIKMEAMMTISRSQNLHMVSFNWRWGIVNQDSSGVGLPLAPSLPGCKRQGWFSQFPRCTLATSIHPPWQMLARYCSQGPFLPLEAITLVKAVILAHISFNYIVHYAWNLFICNMHCFSHGIISSHHSWVTEKIQHAPCMPPYLN